MAHGGGTWLTQNKVLPGTYINFTSVSKASATLSDRGIAAAPFILDWGPENAVFEVTSGDFQKKSLYIFGHNYLAPEMLCLREIFCHATKVLCYRLGTGGVRAAAKLNQSDENAFATAKYTGTLGNSIRVVIAVNVDDANAFDVSTYVGTVNVDVQTVTTAAALENNDFVEFNTEAPALSATAGLPLTGGVNPTIDGAAHQAFLDKIEAYAYNALCCPSVDETVVRLYTAFCRRVRDEVGAKFQLVAWNAAADYEGVIGVWNESRDKAGNVYDGEAATDCNALVYWITGAEAGVAVNKSLTNYKYDGELIIDVEFTQSDLEKALKAGKLMFHNVNGDVRLLEDINSLVTFTDEKGADFQSNQTMRVCDQIANDVAVLFNTRYIGIVANDDSGRATLWNDIVKLIRELEKIRAVENFNPEKVTVELGDTKKSVLLTVNGLNITNAMAQLYMAVIIQ